MMFQIERPINEAIRMYEPGSQSRQLLKDELKRMAAERIEIPCVIGGRDVATGRMKKVVMPHDHQHVLADFHSASGTDLHNAVQAALKAKSAWESMPWNERAGIFLRAADLIAG